MFSEEINIKSNTGSPINGYSGHLVSDRRLDNEVGVDFLVRDSSNSKVI